MGTTIDDRTANRDYRKPYIDNDLDFDIARLRTTLDMIDVDVATLIAQAVGFATKASPIFTGSPEAPTPPGGDVSNRLATTAFVDSALGDIDTSTLAPRDSPVFIGNPQAPTKTVSDNSTSLATTAFVKLALAALIGTAPAALDTLNELAAALGNDPNFAATITASLATKADISAVNPVGTVIMYPATAAPTGYLKCNGAAYSRTTYADLFAKIGTTYGAGDGSTTFNVPDFRGEFIRGLDDGRGVDTSRTLGSAQASQNLSHAHTVTDPGHAHSVYDPAHAHSVYDPGHAHSIAVRAIINSGPLTMTVSSTAATSAMFTLQTDRVVANAAGTGISIYGAGTGIGIYAAVTGVTVAANGGAEARPRNQALLFCIKY